MAFSLAALLPPIAGRVPYSPSGRNKIGDQRFHSGTHVLRFEQIDQMTFGWKDLAIARTHRGADVFRLAGFLGDDDLFSHLGAWWRT